MAANRVGCAVSVFLAGHINLSLGCANGHNWTARASYNPTHGSLRLFIPEHAYCPTCSQPDVDPHGAAKESEAPGKIRVTMDPMPCSECNGNMDIHQKGCGWAE